MVPGLGVVESAWLFRRGAQAVRIVKVSHPGEARSLIVLGPGASQVTHYFDEPLACALHQCEIERQLASRDFWLAGMGNSGTRLAPPPRFRTAPPRW